MVKMIGKGWVGFNKECGDKIQIVGDDLLVTNPTRIKNVIEENVCNALLLKVNQIGSLSEVIMTSHKSGETEDYKLKLVHHVDRKD